MSYERGLALAPRTSPTSRVPIRLLLTLICVSLLSAPVHAAERERSLVAAGLRRTYKLITPDKPQPLLPLIIVYHGGGQTAEQSRRYARFDELPRKESVVVVYPQGLDNDWNDGRRSAALDQRAAARADDVEFTRQIIAELEIEAVIDPTRVFLTGASNGGMMALRAACALGSRVSGVALVVASQPSDWMCEADAMPALFINGTADDYMPFAGGAVAGAKLRRDLGRVLSVDDTIAEFKRIDGCDGVKETKTLDKVGRDNTKAVVTDYDCKTARLKQIVIEGGGHTWPSARGRLLNEFLLGETSEEIDATAEIWNFFKER